MTSATRSRAATLAGLLIGVLACEGEYRPYAPAQGAGASSSLAPETAQPALTPSPAGSPLELPGAEAQLTQPSEDRQVLAPTLPFPAVPLTWMSETRLRTRAPSDGRNKSDGSDLLR